MLQKGAPRYHPVNPYLSPWRHHLQDSLQFLRPILTTFLKGQDLQLCSLRRGRLFSRTRLSDQMIQHRSLYRGRKGIIEAARRNAQGNNRLPHRPRMGLGCQRHLSHIGRLNHRMLRGPASTDFRDGISATRALKARHFWITGRLGTRFGIEMN